MTSNLNKIGTQIFQITQIYRIKHKKTAQAVLWVVVRVPNLCTE